MSEQALVVIDLQLGLLNMTPRILKGEQLLSTASMLIASAREANVPIIFIQHLRPDEDAEDPQLAIHPALDIQDYDTVVVKAWPDAFFETSLEAELRRAGVRKIIATGLQTEFCVDTSCRRAFSLGFDVTLAADGHSTWDSDSLTAQQIIDHHNRVLGDWFAEIKPASDIHFAIGDLR